jgi:hypothetical protein
MWIHIWKLLQNFGLGSSYFPAIFIVLVKSISIEVKYIRKGYKILGGKLKGMKLLGRIWRIKLR